MFRLLSIRRSGFCILLSLVTVSSAAQKDSTRFNTRFAVYTDLILDMLREHNIGAEVQFARKFAVGASAGKIAPWRNNDLRDLLIASHEQIPGRVAQGSVYKVFGKMYVGRQKRMFLKTEVLYRETAYDSVRFSDAKIVSGGGSEAGLVFWRNERSFTWGSNI
jgi:hypothetical protein